MGSLSAQNVGSTRWESERDFRSVEDQIVTNILWLEANPFSSRTNDTKAITRYVLEWVTNTPYITVANDTYFTDGIVNSKRYKYDEKFRVTYLFGKTLYTIRNQDNPNEVDATVRGIEGMVTVYNEILRVDNKVKHRDLDNYKLLAESGRLREYVSDRLKSGGI